MKKMDVEKLELRMIKKDVQDNLRCVVRVTHGTNETPVHMRISHGDVRTGICIR